VEGAIAAGHPVVDLAFRALPIALEETALAGRGAVPPSIQIRVGPYVGFPTLGADEKEGVSGALGLLQPATTGFHAVGALILSRILGILASRAFLAAEERT
jgi:hypothetical protein